MHEKNEPVTETLGDSPHSYTLKRYKPSADLSHFVEDYWIVRWDSAGDRTSTAEIAPFPTVTITVTGQSSEVTGAVTSKRFHQLKSDGAVLGIKFRPGGFYPFYKKSMERLTNVTLPLSEIFGATQVKKLVEQLPASDNKLVAAAEKLLRFKKPKEDGAINVINDIITNLQSNSDITTVQEASRIYGVSEQTLQYSFQKYVGVGLKWVINRYRLQDVANAIDDDITDTDWKGLASDYGFDDQARFIRDFTKIIGETPEQYSQHSR